jgi:hypothetical protein
VAAGTDRKKNQMIVTHAADVDPDIYCYDTGLTFGAAAAQNILQQVLADETVFERRNNYYNSSDNKSLVRLIGVEKTRELIRRKQQIAQQYPDQQPITFKQFFLNEALGAALLAQTPDWLKITTTEPDAMLQVGLGGNILPAHKGHHRKCSLFMLLQGSGQETCWYRPTENFEIIDPLRIPDLDKVEKVVSVVMEPRRWYLFNHAAWHSVHRYSNAGPARINIGIDYRSIQADQLLRLIKQNT